MQANNFSASWSFIVSCRYSSEKR